MIKSFYIAAMTMAMVLVAGIAMAETVDIGTGRMDRAEFEALRQMVSGDYHPTASISTPVPSDTKVAEFYQRDVDAIRQAMVAGSTEITPVSKNSMVDIGTGSMKTTEFCSLNKLVASNNRDTGFAFICP